MAALSKRTLLIISIERNKRNKNKMYIYRLGRYFKLYSIFVLVTHTQQFLPVLELVPHQLVRLFTKCNKLYGK